MGEEKPTLGSIVFYRVTRSDIDDLLCFGDTEILPAVIVRVWSDDCVNLQVFPDGLVGLVWKTSVVKGDNPGNWTNWEP